MPKKKITKLKVQTDRNKRAGSVHKSLGALAGAFNMLNQQVVAISNRLEDKSPSESFNELTEAVDGCLEDLKKRVSRIEEHLGLGEINEKETGDSGETSDKDAPAREAAKVESEPGKTGD